MSLLALRLLAQPILQSALAVAAIGAAALVLCRRAETKLVRIPVESDRRQRRRD